MNPESEEELQAMRPISSQTQSMLEQERQTRAAAERNCALKDELLAAVSHELRSPLGAILGWAHILKRSTDPEDFAKGLDVIEQSVLAQTRLIEDLSDMNRITSGQLRLEIKPVEPRSFIDAAVEAVRRKADAREIRIGKVLNLKAGPVAGAEARGWAWSSSGTWCRRTTAACALRVLAKGAARHSRCACP